MIYYFLLFVLIFLSIVVFLSLKSWFADDSMITGDYDAIKDLAANPRSRSESDAIKQIESILSAKFPTINPDWLKYEGVSLELDGYNKNLGIALEFSGPLHYKWFPNKESYNAYFSRIVKDMAKKKICKKNNVCLVELPYIIPRMLWRDYIKSRLYDCEKIEQIFYLTYIPKQDIIPYRNYPLERQLNLAVSDDLLS